MDKLHKSKVFRWILAIFPLIISAVLITFVLVFKFDTKYDVVYIVDGTVIRKQLDEGADITSGFSPSKEGYSFNGWYLNSEFTIPVPEDYQLTSDIEIYAQLIPNEYIVRYHSNNGSGQVFERQATFDNYFELESNPYTKEDFYFVGWATTPSENDLSKIYVSTSNLKLVTKGLDLYAIYARDVCNISYVTSDPKVSITSDKQRVYVGYIFQFTDKDFVYPKEYVLKFKYNGETYNVGDKIEINEDVEVEVFLVADTTALSFTLVKNADGVGYYQVKSLPSVVPVSDTLIIPDTYNGLPVKQVKFISDKYKKVVIQKGVEVIDNEAFYGCQKLENIIFEVTR